MGSERGQATVEWTGLVLLVSVALGALLTLAPSLDGRGLGGSVAHAITCAARGGCAAAGRAAVPRRAPAIPGRTPPLPGRAPPRPGRARPGSGRALPPARLTGPPARRRIPPSGAGEAPGSLRGVRTAAKRVWLLCLGYRRFRYDLKHPRAPTEPLPLSEALDIANECLNPLGFLAED